MNTAELYQKEIKKNNLISSFVTIGVHALILILIWYFVIMPPNPPLSEAGGSGSLISIGFENMGGPDLIPVDALSAQQTPQPKPEIDETPTITQDVEDAPEVVKKDEKKETIIKKVDSKKDIIKVEKKIEKPIEKPREVDKHALFKKNTNTGTSNGSGTGNIPGNQGIENGDPNGKPDGNGKPGNGGNREGYGTGNGVGNGNGDGVGTYELRGRSLQRKPDVNDNSRETGKVVVAIVVDRNGKVIKATPGQKGTTTLSPTLLEKAKQGALDARFSPKPDGPEEQYGTMTFIFRFKQ